LRPISNVYSIEELILDIGVVMGMAQDGDSVVRCWDIFLLLLHVSARIHTDGMNLPDMEKLDGVNTFEVFFSVGGMESILVMVFEGGWDNF
jgi:hypothetical protein